MSYIPIWERLLASSLWSESEINLIYLINGGFATFASPIVHSGSSFDNGLISDKLTDTDFEDSLSFFFEDIDLNINVYMLRHT